MTVTKNISDTYITVTKNILVCVVQVADPCVKEVLHLPSSETEKEGEATVKYLFSFGASCLERCVQIHFSGTLTRINFLYTYYSAAC